MLGKKYVVRGKICRRLRALAAAVSRIEKVDQGPVQVEGAEWIPQN